MSQRGAGVTRQLSTCGQPHRRAQTEGIGPPESQAEDSRHRLLGWEHQQLEPTVDIVCPVPTTLDQLAVDHAETDPHRRALIYAGRVISYGELEAAVRSLTGQMSHAGLAGERVALMLPNSPETVITYLACFRAGAAAAPLNSRYAPPEIERALRLAEPAWLIVHADRLPLLEQVDPEVLTRLRVLVVGDSGQHNHETLAPLLSTTLDHAIPRPSPDQPAVLFFTSGSTGTPKAVVHTQRSALAMLTSTSEALGDVGPSDLIQVCEPQVHVSGFIGTLTALLGGASVALYDGFDLPTYVAGLGAHRPTLVCTHIDILAQLVRAPGSSREWFASFRGVYTGGDTVPNALQREFLTVTGHPIAVGYGMTEAIWLTVVREPRLDREGCIGVPVGGAELQADPSTGEILVRGPMLANGYWHDEERTQESFVNGWLCTGDIGEVDEGGVWWFRGRIKDLIVRRTSKITPGEIESALDEHPEIASAAGVAAPDADEGQVPVAYLVRRPGSHVSADDVAEFLHVRLAAYKVPARFHFLDALPLTQSGKISHRDLLGRDEGGPG
jgi:long-chain acyl-CoA synthetase